MSVDIHRDREFCHSILTEFTKSESLLKHAYAVETCVEAYAEKYNEDKEYWANCALLHDFDYEMYPDLRDHPFKGNDILAEKGFEEEFRKSIMAHAEHTGEPRNTLLKKVLFACDELAGFITAVTYVRPNRDIDEVKVKSVKKKLKDKAFARAVSREDIYKGVEELGVELDEHIQFCISAMQKKKELLGLG